MMQDTELARRSLIGFGEMVAALGRCGAGADSEVRRPNALGARITAAANNPWFDAAVVPPDATPPDDDALLPHCVWSVADAVPGRVEDVSIATRCMGVELDDASPTFTAVSALNDQSSQHECITFATAPSLAVVGDINERAYGDFGVFAPLVGALRDDRIRTHGVLIDDDFVCVALTLAVGDDISIQYVATESEYRRRGFASELLLAVMAAARHQGIRTATLQASLDGLSVYERLGFRSVATLRGYVRVAESQTAPQ